MLRKSLIAVILLVSMPVSTQATRRTGDFDSILYSPQKACVIPVIMDIGVYVEILDI